MKTNRIFWGCAFIIAAILIVLEAVGTDLFLFYDIPFGRLLIGALLIYMLIYGIVNKKLGNILFSISLIFMVFEPYIAKAINYPSSNIISNWLLLLCTFLVYIGLSIIFPSSGKKVKTDGSFNFGSQKCNIAGETIKYVDCTDFVTTSVNNKMSKTDVFFENQDRYQGNATVDVQNKMGQTVIHIPSSWHIVCTVDNIMGRVNLPSSGNPDGKVINIVGNNKMGDVDIELV